MTRKTKSKGDADAPSTADNGARIDALEGRLAEVEAQLAARPSRKRHLGVDHELLENLRHHPRFAGEEFAGGVVYAGAVEIGHANYVWEIRRGVADLLATDAERLAPVMAALGHPARLRVVIQILKGPISAQELIERVEESSIGKLYHHLKELMAAKVVVQPRRGTYEIAPAAVVPLLAALSLSTDLSGDASVVPDPEG